MPKFNVKRTYRFPADQVFAVASDVASYHKFIPLVKASRVWNVRKEADGTESFKAALNIRYKRLKLDETIESDMVLDPKAMMIRAKSSDGVISSLGSFWKVTPLADGTSEVEMDVDYTMKSKMMQVLVSSMFDLALRRIANALGERVEELYGSKVQPA
jgi:coenzyme Q-binding protein COQ10